MESDSPSNCCGFLLWFRGGTSWFIVEHCGSFVTVHGGSLQNCCRTVFQKSQYKDVQSRTIESLQCACIFKVGCCLKVHNAPLKLASPISGCYSLVVILGWFIMDCCGFLQKYHLKSHVFLYWTNHRSVHYEISFFMRLNCCPFPFKEQSCLLQL